MWEAKSLLERGIGLAAEMPAFFPPFAGDLAVVYALTGRGAEALDLAERAVHQAQSMRRLGRLSLIVTHLGEVRLLTGHPEAAEAEGRRALALAEAHKERGNMVYALRLLGLAAAEKPSPDLERARGHHTDALALAEELGMRTLAARCHLGLGRLARRTGDVAAADKHLSEARALFEEMGMTFWLERLHLDSSTAPGPGLARAASASDHVSSTHWTRVRRSSTEKGLVRTGSPVSARNGMNFSASAWPVTKITRGSASPKRLRRAV